MGLIGAIGKLVSLIAGLAGKTEKELLAEVQADCDARAKDPTDETDDARSEIEADLPD
jgi:hypothetical protein